MKFFKIHRKNGEGESLEENNPEDKIFWKALSLMKADNLASFKKTIKKLDIDHCCKITNSYSFENSSRDTYESYTNTASLLHYAIYLNKVEFVKCLIDLGTDINVTYHWEWFYHRMEYYYDQGYSEPGSVDNDSTKSDAYTALPAELAAENGRIKILKLLLDNDAKKESKNLSNQALNNIKKSKSDALDDLDETDNLALEIDQLEVTGISIANSENNFDNKGKAAVDEDELESSADNIPQDNKPYIGRYTIDGKERHYYAFPSEAHAKEYQIPWQQKTCYKFFKLGKNKKVNKVSTKFFHELLNHINNNQGSIKINNITARSFIIALNKLTTHYKGMPEVSFLFGQTNILFSPSDNASKIRQHGNFKMVIPSLNQYQIKYGDGCIKRITYLFGKNSSREQQFKNILLDKIKNLTPFTAQDINKDEFIKLNCELCYSGTLSTKIQQNLDFLNGLIFLIAIVEVLVRLYRDKDGNMYDYPQRLKDKATKSDNLPVALAQARSLLLYVDGKITLNAFLGETYTKSPEQHRAQFGCVTGIKTIDNLDVIDDKLEALNNLYEDFLSKELWSKSESNIVNSIKNDNSNAYFMSGRTGLYTDLTRIYDSGNESDPDDSGYSDDDLNYFEYGFSN